MSAQLVHTHTNNRTLQRLQEAWQSDDVRVIEQVEKKILDLSDLLRATQIQEKDANFVALQKWELWNKWQRGDRRFFSTMPTRFIQNFLTVENSILRKIHAGKIALSAARNYATTFSSDYGKAREESAPKKQGPEAPLECSARLYFRAN